MIGNWSKFSFTVTCWYGAAGALVIAGFLVFIAVSAADVMMISSQYDGDIMMMLGLV